MNKFATLKKLTIAQMFCRQTTRALKLVKTITCSLIHEVTLTYCNKLEINCRLSNNQNSILLQKRMDKFMGMLKQISFHFQKKKRNTVKPSVKPPIDRHYCPLVRGARCNIYVY